MGSRSKRAKRAVEATDKEDDVQIKCPDCGQVFSEMSDMGQHRITKHFLRSAAVQQQENDSMEEDASTGIISIVPLSAITEETSSKSDSDDEAKTPTEPPSKNEHGRHPCVIAGCKVSFSNLSHLRRHVKDVHREDPSKLQLYKRNNASGATDFYKCPVENCMAQIKRTNHMRRHIRQIHNKDPNAFKLISRPPEQPKPEKIAETFPCTVRPCIASFTRKEHMLRHVRSKHGADPNSGATSVIRGLRGLRATYNPPFNPNSLIQPKLSTPSEKRFPCVVKGCGTGFSSKQYLGVHLRKIHNLDPDKLVIGRKNCNLMDAFQSDTSDDTDDSGDYSDDSGGKNDPDMVEAATVCSICCSSFFSEETSSVSGAKEDEKLFSSRFKQFINELVKNQTGFKPHYLLYVKRLLSSICPNCLVPTKTAMDKRTVLEKVERDVLKIQRKAEKGAKRLQTKMEEYNCALRKIEEVVNDGDFLCLKAQLERNPERAKYNSLVMLLREGITSAENNVQMQYGHLQSTFCDDKVRVETSHEKEETFEKEEVDAIKSITKQDCTKTSPLKSRKQTKVTCLDSDSEEFSPSESSDNWSPGDD